ncbi:Lrp/AsnC family transcriptional regulator [Flavobacteriaceae bacterium]|jgi:Lrp/AsnC family leucine-responsive transcriptional regulator|nr:Lrp/AsnC family transcriptional regulator [Flavobacteriaceae bacterium]MBT7241824.1 Lrp/AsnC family transcriptional regulator [Flavobacteriaceae bacterium]MDB9913492.1 Lrp/AsnC family transcriptional regulator [Flavobacteriaceae bacterium]MDC0538955.1 Lrp/AsnC family transcriptional regulator [Flavobacteriaceae bacterium]
MKKELDSKDIQILSLLLNNARLSNKEIAAKIEIAQSSTHDRIKKLTQKGYFKGTSIQIDQKKLGLNIEVMLAIKLNKQHRSVIGDFIKKASQLPGVLQLFHMAGDNDFILHVAVKDSDELRVFILDRLSTLDYIQSTQTTMVLHNEKVNNIL